MVGAGPVKLMLSPDSFDAAAAPKTVLQAERRDGLEARRPLVQGFFVTLAGLGLASTG